MKNNDEISSEVSIQENMMKRFSFGEISVFYKDFLLVLKFVPSSIAHDLSLFMITVERLDIPLSSYKSEDDFTNETCPNIGCKRNSMLV
jgi:hypothetical protein